MYRKISKFVKVTSALALILFTFTAFAASQSAINVQHLSPQANSNVEIDDDQRPFEYLRAGGPSVP